MATSMSRSVPAISGAMVLGLVVSGSPTAQTTSTHVLSTRMQALEKRLADLEALTSAAPKGATTQVRAPFEIIDREGRPIVRIQEWGRPMGGGVYVLNRDGHVAASIGPVAGQRGGKVTVLAGDGSNKVSALYFLENGSGIILGRADGETGIEIDASRSELTILNESGDTAVSLGATASGAGRLKLAVDPK